jgi:hypothetical protein
MEVLGIPQMDRQELAGLGQSERFCRKSKSSSQVVPFTKVLGDRFVL